jgi:vacuolar protein sorting-associated protein 26
LVRRPAAPCPASSPGASRLTCASEMFFDRGNHHEFLSLGQELAAPGELQHPQTFEFNFKNVEKQYESYNGINVKLRYFVRVTVSRRMADVVREKDLWVYSYRIPPETNSSIKMDVGIEDCLHIEFEYSKSKYHLKDVIVGRIYFLLVRLKIKHMELSIIRRETTGAAPNQYNESETLVRFEIMDGSPSRGTYPVVTHWEFADKNQERRFPLGCFSAASTSHPPSAR